jgi:hypothetical protein
MLLKGLLLLLLPRLLLLAQPADGQAVTTAVGAELLMEAGTAAAGSGGAEIVNAALLTQG